MNTIKCSVINCVYNHKKDCTANHVEVGCNCSHTPTTDSETLCCTFRKK